MPNNIYNFLIWLEKECSHFQSNACTYNNKVYFLDRRKQDNDDGGLDDLWAVYIKEILG